MLNKVDKKTLVVDGPKLELTFTPGSQLKEGGK